MDASQTAKHPINERTIEQNTPNIYVNLFDGKNRLRQTEESYTVFK